MSSACIHLKVVYDNWKSFDITKFTSVLPLFWLYKSHLIQQLVLDDDCCINQKIFVLIIEEHVLKRRQKTMDFLLKIKFSALQSILKHHWKIYFCESASWKLFARIYFCE